MVKELIILFVVAIFIRIAVGAINFLITNLKNKIEESKNIKTQTDSNFNQNTNSENNQIKITLPLIKDDEEFSSKDAYNEYVNKIGDNFVAKNQLKLTDEELQQMSITDAVEMIRLECWAMEKLFTTSPELKNLITERIEKNRTAIKQKLFNLDEIFVVFSKTTGCPYLFSKTFQQKDQYVCTPPQIRIYTKPILKIVEESLENDGDFEIRKIENGADKTGIHDFLGQSFYMDGACGIEISIEECSFTNEELVAPPDFSNVPEVSIPVMNPDVMRWSLLISQLGYQETEEGQLIFKLYYGHLMNSLQNAKFLMPLKPGENFPKPTDKAETFTLKKDTTFAIATMPGKNEKNAVMLYTDWKRLYEHFGKDEGWNANITTIDGIISIFDCAINVDNKYRTRGFYITQEDFERFKK